MRHSTKKDWRKRSWPSGENDQGFKRIYSQRVRRKALSEELTDGGMWKKMNNSYDINDFK